MPGTAAAVEIDGEIPEIERRALAPPQINIARLYATDELIAFVNDPNLDAISLRVSDAW
jgi:hypothetical protein